MFTISGSSKFTCGSLAALVFVLLGTTIACSRPAATLAFKKIPAGQENTGFLSSYANLKPNPEFENTRTFVSQDALKNLHRYIAIIVDKPVVYVSTDVDEQKISEDGVAALTEYFHEALDEAVEDAFPVLQSPGPLVLRLRSAVVGVDAGDQLPAAQGDAKSMHHALNIGKVAVEMELVDSETGEQIAAAVDRQNLGEGAVIGSASFTREEKFRAATRAFDGWAHRLRNFMDSASERSPEDVARIEDSNFPYATPGKPLK
jgi:hypothetical protein